MDPTAGRDQEMCVANPANSLRDQGVFAPFVTSTDRGTFSVRTLASVIEVVGPDPQESELRWALRTAEALSKLLGAKR
jgi:hypothetical protein